MKAWLQAAAEDVARGGAREAADDAVLPAPGAYSAATLAAARTCMAGAHKLLQHVQGRQLEQVRVLRTSLQRLSVNAA